MHKPSCASIWVLFDLSLWIGWAVLKRRKEGEGGGGGGWVVGLEDGLEQFKRLHEYRDGLPSCLRSPPLFRSPYFFFIFIFFFKPNKCLKHSTLNNNTLSLCSCAPALFLTLFLSIPPSKTSDIVWTIPFLTIQVHTRTHVRAHTHTHTYTLTLTLTHTHTHTHTEWHIQWHIFLSSAFCSFLSLQHTHTHTQTHTHVHTHTFFCQVHFAPSSHSTHTHTHTHTHVHTHTHTELHCIILTESALLQWQVCHAKKKRKKADLTTVLHIRKLPHLHMKLAVWFSFPTTNNKNPMIPSWSLVSIYNYSFNPYQIFTKNFEKL